MAEGFLFLVYLNVCCCICKACIQVRLSKLSLKKKFLDSLKKNGSNMLSGKEWYNLKAFKAINQAVGWVIRHKSETRDFLKIVNLQIWMFEYSLFSARPAKHKQIVKKMVSLLAKIVFMSTFLSSHSNKWQQE